MTDISPKTNELSARRDLRTGLSVEDLKQAFLDNLFYALNRTHGIATKNDLYTALALTVRDRVFHRSIHTLEQYGESKPRIVAYLSAEFLPGPHLGHNILALGITEQTQQALSELGYDLDELLEQEEEPGLGNGGLGRLASCFLDSLASLAVPAIGYGIRYEFGIFDQAIHNGWQTEVTDKWLRFGNPWEIGRPEVSYDVNFGGRTEAWKDDQGRYRVLWIPETVVKGAAYDTPILGYQGGTCNLMRLWKAEAIESFDFAAFNQGDYYGAVEDKVTSENITKVLYPNDEPIQGKILRLQQQAFFVSCSLRDMLRIHGLLGGKPQDFHEQFAVQLNDTHPAIAVAELMRLLVDEHQLDWDVAWQVTSHTIAYTNHTLLPEALEKWPLRLFGRLLPRHLEIIYEINRRFLEEVSARFPNDNARLRQMSLIDESGERYIRMAHLATVAAQRVNGVAELHSTLLKKTALRDFAELWPEKFCNVTNGISPRRFLAMSNPGLAHLITDRIGSGWLHDLYELRKLEAFADEVEFQGQWSEVKLVAKRNLARLVEEHTGIRINPESLFDIQSKRIHEYKRQHLNVLHILTEYLRLKNDPHADVPARTFIFAGKAAPGYVMAKLIIKLVHVVAELVDRDPIVRDRLKVVFFPNYNVKNAQHLFPAADLSEQISTAGMEASGTGNMKFALNGALTIGTLDGANVEIREEVGADNFFLFGLNAEQVREVKSYGYRSMDYYEQNPVLREVVNCIGTGVVKGEEAELFHPLVENLLRDDPFLLLADYQSYIDCQDQVNALWADQKAWRRKSILNVARMGKFSADRSIREYCERVWNVKSPSVEVKR